jgi:hypothetical protein
MGTASDLAQWLEQCDDDTEVVVMLSRDDARSLNTSSVLQRVTEPGGSPDRLYFTLGDRVSDDEESADNGEEEEDDDDDE